MVTNLDKHDEFSSGAESLNFIICPEDLQICDFCCKMLVLPSREISEAFASDLQGAEYSCDASSLSTCYTERCL